MGEVKAEPKQRVEMPQPSTGGELVRADEMDQAQVISRVLSMPDEEKRAVAEFLNIEADDPALPAYLALCVKHNLSPFLGEIYLIEQKVKIRNADGSQVERYRKKPGAGRDGFLSVAQKSGSWLGLQSDVHCEHDTFEVYWTVGPDGKILPPESQPLVVHRHAKVRPGREAREYRGKIIGAWAIAYRRDAYPVFFYAPLKEHGKTGSGQAGPYWKGAWGYTSAMICKAAESMVLRKAYSITGVVPMDELRLDPDAFRERGERITIDHEPAADEFEDVHWGESEEVRERLRAAVDRANAADAWSWNAAKCQMAFHGKSDEDLVGLAEQIEAEAAKAEGTAAVKADEPELVDAEVVGQEEPEDDERVRGLQNRTRELTNRMNDLDPGSEEHQALGEELDLVNRELTQLRPPEGQSSLDVDG